MLPHLDPQLIQFVHAVKCRYDQTQTAQFLLEHGTGTPLRPSLPSVLTHSLTHSLVSLLSLSLSLSLLLQMTLP